MLELLIVILVVLWATGHFVVHFGGDLIHLLLVVAVIVVLVRIIRGRPPV